MARMFPEPHLDALQDVVAAVGEHRRVGRHVVVVLPAVARPAVHVYPEQALAVLRAQASPAWVRMQARQIPDVPVAGTGWLRCAPKRDAGLTGNAPDALAMEES